MTAGSLIASFIGSILLPANNKDTLLVKILIAILSLIGILLTIKIILKLLKNKNNLQKSIKPFIIEERTISISKKANIKKQKELKAELEYFVTKYQLNQ